MRSTSTSPWSPPQDRKGVSSTGTGRGRHQSPARRPQKEAEAPGERAFSRQPEETVMTAPGKGGRARRTGGRSPVRDERVDAVVLLLDGLPPVFSFSPGFIFINTIIGEDGTTVRRFPWRDGERPRGLRRTAPTLAGRKVCLSSTSALRLPGGAMLGLPTISSPASRPSLEETKRFTTPRTKLTPRASAPAWGDNNPKQEPGGWPQAFLFGIAGGSREQGKKRGNAKMDDSALLRPSLL